MQVRDEDGGDVGQHGVHGVSIVSAELAEGSLATVQQQRLAQAAANRKQEMMCSTSREHQNSEQNKVKLVLVCHLAGDVVFCFCFCFFKRV